MSNLEAQRYFLHNIIGAKCVLSYVVLTSAICTGTDGNAHVLSHCEIPPGHISPSGTQDTFQIIPKAHP